MKFHNIINTILIICLSLSYTWGQTDTIQKVDKVNPCNTNSFMGISGYNIKGISGNALPFKQQTITELDLNLVCPNNTLSTTSTEAGYWREQQTNNTSLFTDNKLSTTTFLGEIEKPYSIEWISEKNCIEKRYQKNITLSAKQEEGWVKKAGNTSFDAGAGISTDVNGNVYVTGFFSGVVTFGATTLVSNGATDVFVAKYDANGNVLWVKQAGGISDDVGYGYEISTDVNGNVYVTGYFSGTAIFGTTTLISNGAFDVFVAKYDANGNVLWVKQAGGISDDRALDISIDVNANVYVTGYFEGTATFGATTLTSSGSYDVFVAKYDANGNVLWAKSAGGTSGDDGRKISIDNQGNLYLTGRFLETSTFGSNTLISNGATDVFVAKYDANGNVLWVKSVGGIGDDGGYGVITDLKGNLYVIGSFESTATFGTTTLVSNGATDVFVAKYDANGNVIWVKNAGGTDPDYVSGVSMDMNDNVYVTGSFVGTATFGTTSLTSNGGIDVFVAKYDANGNVIWVKSAGGTDSDYASAISTDVNNNVYVTGYFYDTATFGSTALTSSGGIDFFLYQVIKANATQVQACNISSATLSTESTESGKWRFAIGSPTDATISSLTDPNATLTGTLGKTYTLEWLTDGVGCDKKKYTCTVLLKQKKQSVVTEDDLELSCPNNFNLITSATETGFWREQQTNNTALFTDNSDAKTAFIGDIEKEYAIEWATEKNCLETFYQKKVIITLKEEEREGWAKNIGKSCWNSIVTTDNQGNIYVTGIFAGTANFGEISLTTPVSDIFVVKYDASGNVLWAQSTQNEDIIPNSITVDKNGNVYVCGHYMMLPDNGFIVKYDANGNLLSNTNTSFVGRGLATDSNGNLYLTGEFYGNVTFGSTTLMASNGWWSSDLFIVKYDENGTVLWAKSSGNQNNNMGVKGITVDNTGNVYVTGSFQNDFQNTSALFGPTSGGRDAFVIKYDANGNIVWAKKGGGTADDTANSLTVDNQGNVYVVGDFSGTASFGTTTLTSVSNDVFIIKYNVNGNVLWGKQGKGNGSAKGISINNQEVYLTGLFFGNITFGTTTLTTLATNEVFVVKYDTDGNVLSAKNIGGENNTETGGGISTTNGNVYVVGDFSGTASFGTTTLTSNGSNNIFVYQISKGSNTSIESNCNENSVALSTESTESGKWQFESGSPTDATISSLTNPNATLTGTLGKTYTLKWITDGTGCNKKKYITSVFLKQKTQATIVEEDLALTCPNNTLAANSTIGFWREQQTNNTSLFTNNTDPTTTFLGDIEKQYAIEWVSDKNCALNTYQKKVTLVAQQEKTWAKNAGGGSSDYAYGISTDGNGNVYVTGYFGGTATFGTTFLTSSGLRDVFIAKYDVNGNVLWAQKAGGTSADEGYSISTDANGNVYVTGSFQGTATFGTTFLTSSGLRDVFIAKYDANGNVLWAQKAGGTIDDVGYGISTDKNGNVYVTGHFQGTATFGTTSLTSTGSPEVFVVKYGANGNVLWVQKTGGTSSGKSINTDANDNVYVTGSFYGTATFGTTSLTSTGSADVFMAQYDANGNVLWAQKAGGTSADEGYSISTDANGNVYVTGSFWGTATFGTTSLTSSGGSNVFVAKYDANGNVLWAQKAGGTSSGKSISTDVNGNVYVTGSFQGTATFGTTSLTSSVRDIFVYQAVNNNNNTHITSNCNENSVTLSTKSTDTGKWKFVTDSTTNATISSLTDPNATFTGTLGKTYTLEWITDGVACNQQKFTTSVFLKQKTQSTIVEDDLELICPNNTLSVSSTTGFWREQQTNNTSLFTDNTDPTTAFIGDLGKQYAIEWVSDKNCALTIYQKKVKLIGEEISSTGWAKNAGGDGNSNDEGYGISTDANGNVYVTGYFYGTATFGNTTLTASQPTDGNWEVFVVKYDVNGNVLWANNHHGQGYAISTDNNGNSYVTGSFLNTITIGNTTLTSNGSYDIFVAKYDTDGNVLWAKSYGGTSNDEGYGISTDNNGNSYVTGYFSDKATFGTTSLTSSGNNDIFIAKYDTDGNVLWAKKGGGSQEDRGKGINVDTNGNIYLTGYFKGSANFDFTFFLNSTASFGGDVFVAKYAPNGTILWAKQATTTSYSQGYSITTDNNNVYVTGRFSGTGTFGTTSLIANGADIFVMKYDKNGAFLWAKKAGGTGVDEGHGITTDNNGNVYVTGSFGLFANSATFDETTLTSSGDDVFVAKYDATGKVIWAKKGGGTSSDIGKSITTDNNGNVYLTGSFSNTATIGSTTFTANAGKDVFIYQVVQSANTQITSNCNENSVTLSTKSTDTGKWKFVTDSTTNATISSLTDPNATFTGTLGKTYTLEWITDGIACNQKVYKTSVFLKQKTETSITEQDLELTCPNTALSTASTQTGFWREQQTNNTALFTNNNVSTTDLIGDLGKQYAIEWVSDKNCALTIYQKKVKLTVNDTKNWAKSAGAINNGNTSGNSVVVDANGNTYVTGTFQNITILDTTVLISNGGDDIFVAKYNADGNVLWAKRAGANRADAAKGISLDNNGNVYVTGYFQGTVTFGSFTLTSTLTPFNQSSDDVFIVKYDPNGNVLWAQKAGGVNGEYAQAIDVDNNGNAYITGYFQNSTTFGSTTLTAKGSNDVFIAKYNTNGTFLWAKNAGGTSTDYGRGISVDNNGNVYITGDFTGDATFGTTDLLSSGTTAAFIAKYNTNGTLLWAQKAGDMSSDFAYGITTDANANVYITGKFGGVANFGTISLTSNGGYDVFVAKYNTNGAIIWAKSGGKWNSEVPKAITVDKNANVYITGTFAGDATFGNTTITSTFNGSWYTSDIFLVKYDVNGNVLWAKNYGGNKDVDYGNSVTVDGNGIIYLTGTFANTATFGTTTLTSVGGVNGGTDVFIMKYDESNDRQTQLSSNCNVNSLTLSTKSTDAGKWRFADGSPTDATISSLTSPTATFTGTLGKTYTLEWVTDGVGCNQKVYNTNVNLKTNCN